MDLYHAMEKRVFPSRPKRRPWQSGALRRAPLSPPVVVVTVWVLLATAPLLTPITGSDRATFLAFIACTALVLGTQTSFRSPARISLQARGIIAFSSALISGWALGPGLGSAVVSVGLRFGWEPAHLLGPSLIGLISTLLLAPAFEEILYREQLFNWLQTEYKAPVALLLSSLAFALPHPGAFSKLAALAAGLILGTTRSLSGGLLPCIGVHAGLNVFGQLAASSFYPAILQRDLGLIIAVPTLALSIALSRTDPGRSR